MIGTKLRAGVIGVGHMGSLHVAKHLQNSAVDLVGVFDTNEERSLMCQQRFGVRKFDSLAELLFEVDAVTIASPTRTHFEVASQAMAAGVHVLLEKPMTGDVGEAETLVSMAEKRGLVLQVGFVERFRLVELSRGIPMVPIHFIECQRFSSSLPRETNIDVVCDLMIHDIDLVLYLLGEQPSHISAIGGRVVTPLWDMANVRLEFPSGAVANLSASRVAPDKRRHLRVFSRSSYFSFDLTTNAVEIRSRNERMEIDRKPVRPGSVDALESQCRNFISSVCDRIPGLTTGRQGLRALRCAEEIRLKLESRMGLLGMNHRHTLPLQAEEIGVT